MKKQMKPSDILRKAASILNSDLSRARLLRGGACNAIERVVGGWPPSTVSANYSEYKRSEYKRAKQLFASLYSIDYCSYWFGFSFTKVEQEHRIIALLLTADMAESVGE